MGLGGYFLLLLFCSFFLHFLFLFCFVPLFLSPCCHFTMVLISFEQIQWACNAFCLVQIKVYSCQAPTAQLIKLVLDDQLVTI